MPTEIEQIEITAPVPSLRAADGAKLKLLVTLRGSPLDYVDLPPRAAGFSEDEASYEIARRLSPAALTTVAEDLFKSPLRRSTLTDADQARAFLYGEFAKSTTTTDPIPPHPNPSRGRGGPGACATSTQQHSEFELFPGQSRPLVSVVVCTVNRPDNLKRCLDALDQLDYPNREIIVVDNNPAGSKCREITDGRPVVYAREARRGLSYARNTGIRRARGEIIALTDDDCAPARDWLDWIVRPFAEPRVMCVTGLVIPAQLENEAQELFEEYGGLGRGFAPKVYGAAFLKRRRLRAVPTWHIGATANAAFRAEGLRRIGLFDVTLGVGTPTGCSEDTYAFYRLLQLGYECVYEPRAYVHHYHRSDRKGLRKQLFGYSKGHYAYHIKLLLLHRDLRALFHMLVFMPLVHVSRIGRSLLRRSRFPIRLILWEMLGNALGPLSLLQSTLRAKRLGVGPDGEEREFSSTGNL